jgi:hypothetical protein
MTALQLQIKKLSQSKGFLLFYLLLLVLLVFSFRGWEKAGANDLKLSVALIDEDTSLESKAFIQSILDNDLLDTVQTSEVHAKKLLKHEVIEVYLIIPRDFFDNFGEKKLSLNYLTHNPLAPVLVDVFSQDLMPYIAKYRLKRASDFYLTEDEPSQALAYFDTFKNNETLALSTDLVLVDSWLGIHGEINQKKLNYANALMGYGLTIITLFISMTLSSSDQNDMQLNIRASSIFHLNIKLFISKRIIHYFLLLLPWLLICLSIHQHINLTSKATISTFVFGLLLLIIYYEGMSLVQLTYNRYLYVQLITTSLVIIPALLGGAFFSTDILSKGLLSIIKWMPFYHMKNLFYQNLTLGHLNTMSMLLVALYLFFIGLLLRYNYLKDTSYRKF